MIYISNLYLIGRCYKSKSPGYTKNTRCASERVEAVTSLDILYNDFHNKVYDIMKDEDLLYSCRNKYPCPDGVRECETRYAEMKQSFDLSMIFILTFNFS